MRRQRREDWHDPAGSHQLHGLVQVRCKFGLRSPDRRVIGSQQENHRLRLMTFHDRLQRDSGQFAGEQLAELDPGEGGGRSFGSQPVRAEPPAVALVPGPGYDDLEIQDGGTASRALEALLLSGEALSAEERQALRDQLLRYCELDTLAMVRLHERLRELAVSG